MEDSLFHIYNISDVKNRIHFHKSFDQKLIDSELTELIKSYDDKIETITNMHDDIQKINKKCKNGFFDNPDPVLSKFCMNVFNSHRSNIEKYNSLIDSTDNENHKIKKIYQSIIDKLKRGTFLINQLVVINNSIDISGKQIDDIYNVVKSNHYNRYATIKCEKNNKNPLCKNIDTLLTLLPELVETQDTSIYDAVNQKAKKTYQKDSVFLCYYKKSKGYQTKRTKCYDMVDFFDFLNRTSFMGEKSPEYCTNTKAYLLKKKVGKALNNGKGYYLQIKEFGRK